MRTNQNETGHLATAPGALVQASQCLQAGDIVRAEQLLRELLRGQPDQLDACLLLAGLCHRQGKLDEALRCYQRVVKIRPRLAEVHHALGLVLRDRGNLAGAVRAFRGEKKDPEDGSPRRLRM